MPRYFDDFQVGQEFVTPARTITEADVVNFAGLTGDYNQIHTDAEFAGDTRFGQRLAHGLLGMSIATGLMARTGIFDGTAVALLGIDSWSFANPIFIGDTIHVRITVKKAQIIKRGDAGVIHRGIEVLNQDGDIVQTGRMPILIARDRAAAASEAACRSKESG